MIDDHKSMEGLTAAEQARKALTHILHRIQRDPHVGWYMGYATESFALATEALATLTGNTPISVRETFAPINPRNPAEDANEGLLKKIRSAQPRFSDDEGMAVDELIELLETQANADYLAAATDSRHAGLEFLQSAERKERLANELVGLKHKFGVEDFA